MRGILGIYDFSTSNTQSLLQRHHLENTVMRQFIEKDGNLLRFNVDVPIVVTDLKPLEPYGDPNATIEKTIPNLHPMNPLVGLWPKNVYNPHSVFPVKVNEQTFSIVLFIFQPTFNYLIQIFQGELPIDSFKTCSHLH
jgi:hypothetical protein